MQECTGRQRASLRKWLAVFAVAAGVFAVA